MGKDRAAEGRDQANYQRQPGEVKVRAGSGRENRRPSSSISSTSSQPPRRARSPAWLSPAARGQERLSADHATRGIRSRAYARRGD
jgi:hypothetical protein